MHTAECNDTEGYEKEKADIHVDDKDIENDICEPNIYCISPNMSMGSLCNDSIVLTAAHSSHITTLTIRTLNFLWVSDDRHEAWTTKT